MKTNSKLTGKLTMMAILVLALVGFVHAETVVVVSAKSSTGKLTAEQVANIYLGKDPGFAPLDLPESSTIRNNFYKQVAGKDAPQVKAIWARLVFTGKSQPPKEVSSAADAIKVLADNPKGIAYVDRSAVDASVKVVLTVN